MTPASLNKMARCGSNIVIPEKKKNTIWRFYVVVNIYERLDECMRKNFENIILKN